MERRRAVWAEKLPVIGAVGLAAVFLAAFLLLDEMQVAAMRLLGWFEELGGTGIILYFGLYVAIVLFLIPGVIFTLGAGLLFGFWLGAAVVVSALAVGASLAFLAARYAFGERLSRTISEHPRLRTLNRGMRMEGWKLVMLSRFVPVFPFKLSNYFFGLTAIPFRHFFFANLVGVLPLALTNVYIGTLTAELAELTERERQPWEWGLYLIGFLAAIGLIHYIGRLARRTMQANAGCAEEKERGEGGEGDRGSENAAQKDR